MPQKSIRRALTEALRQEMRRDPRIIVIGEDVAGGAASDGQRDAYGGVLGVTKGLIGEFGEARVIDTPITESAIMGAAAGAAVTGLRPVAELMFSDFLGVCFEATKQEALNLRFRNATGQLDNTAEIKKVRRQIARINTNIRQREIELAEAAQ